jgi:hypothetical protein
MKWFLKLAPSHQNEKLPSYQNEDLPSIERSNAPTAPTNLLLRFETTNGPRTVIAASVPLQMAREVTDAMTKAGHYAEYVDRCPPHSVADHIVMKKLEQLRMRSRDPGLPASNPTQGLEQKHVTEHSPAVHIAAE